MKGKIMKKAKTKSPVEQMKMVLFDIAINPKSPPSVRVSAARAYLGDSPTAGAESASENASKLIAALSEDNNE